MIFSLILLVFSMILSIYAIIHPDRIFDFSVFWNLRKDLDPNKKEDAIDFIRIKAIVLAILATIMLLADLAILSNIK